MPRRLRATNIDCPAEMAKDLLPGDSCPGTECNGLIGVYRTMRINQSIVRYLKCKTCGHLPANKLVEHMVLTEDK